jgi:MHS family proline/betaine transporter-like MFS transporter
MKNLNKSLLYAFFGHLYEHYSSSLFNFAIPFFGALFFPDNTWMRYYAVASGFLLQPFGALIFSWIGDRFGRRPAIICAFFLSTLPMFCIGFLPNYVTWGVTSSIILIVCRIIQGASVGGAFYGTLTFVNESSSAYARNLNMGIILSMGFIGVIVGMMVFRLVHTYNSDWGWRLPFLIGGCVGLILYGVRRFMVESRVWESAVFEKKVKIPFLQALQQHPLNVVAVLCAGMGTLIPFYIVASWLPGVLIDKGLDSVKILNSSILMMVLGGGGIFLGCCLSSFIDLRKMLEVYVLAWIPCGILLYLGLKNMDVSLISMSQLLIALNTGLCGSAFLLIQRLFPPRYAYSGFAVPYAFGQAILIGPTPLLADMISKSTGKLENAALLMILCPILMGIMLCLAKPVIEKDE